MEKKYRAGARYFITQLGFDASRWENLLHRNARYGDKCPRVRQCVHSAARRGTRDASRRYSRDPLSPMNCLTPFPAKRTPKIKAGGTSLERSAMQVAVLMGMGFRGAHIEAMILKFDMVETIVGRARELKDSWQRMR